MDRDDAGEQQAVCSRPDGRFDAPGLDRELEAEEFHWSVRNVLRSRIGIGLRRASLVQLSVTAVVYNDPKLLGFAIKGDV